MQSHDAKLLHLSDIRCKYFSYWHGDGTQKVAVIERKNEGVYVSCTYNEKMLKNP